MKHDFFDHTPDMNHDGKIDSYDFTLFHEMIDEDQKEEQHRHRPGTIPVAASCGRSIFPL